MIIVTRRDDFTRYVWIFRLLQYANCAALVLDNYSKQERPSKRHNFKVVKSWDRTHTRDNTLSYHDVPKPDNVLQEARLRIFEVITVAWEK